MIVQYQTITVGLREKMKFPIKDFFCNCEQIRSLLQIWSHLLKKFLKGNFIFCAVFHQKDPLWVFDGPKYTFENTRSRNRTGHRRCSIKKGVLKNFTKFCEFCGIFKNTFLQNTSWRLLLSQSLFKFESGHTRRFYDKPWPGFAHHFMAFDYGRHILPYITEMISG